MFLAYSRDNKRYAINGFVLQNNINHWEILSDQTASRVSMTILASRSRSISSQPKYPFSSAKRYARKTDIEAEMNSKSELGQRFVDQVQKSLEEDNFVSLILRGVKKKKGKKKEDEIDLLRGSIRQVQGRLIMISASKKRQKKNVKTRDDKVLLLQLTLKYHGATDICRNFQLEAVPKTIYDLILGDPMEMASEWGVQAVRAQPIQSAELTTTNQTWDLRLDGKVSLQKKTVKNTLGTEANNPLSIAESHDRVKQVPLSNKSEFLERLGVTNGDGKPKPRMKGKLRQCQKFVEIVGRIVDECQKKEQKKISLVDMGCGRAYLTFSLHSYLQERYGSVSSTGIDVRPKLVAEISNIARSLGSTFDSLNFEEGTIEKVVARTSAIQKEEIDDATLNILVALHACDTATDDALYSGIDQNADVIVVAPCCHKQVRPQLNSHFASVGASHPLSSILTHGVYRERISETVTDSLRALLLEFAGYKVQVFEFIGGEHTSKNVMITAIKVRDQGAIHNRKSNVESKRQEIVSLAGLHGISHQKLAHLMGFKIAADEDLSTHNQMPRGNPNRLSKHRMPPARFK